MSDLSVPLQDIDAKDENVGIWYPGNAIIIPVGLTWASLEIDRSQLLNGDDRDAIDYAFEISLDGGKTWGGTWEPEVPDGFRPGRQYPLLIGGTATGKKHSIPHIVVEHSARAVELCQPDSDKRWIRPVTRCKRPLKCGISFKFDDRLIKPAEDREIHHSVSFDAASAAQSFSNASSVTWSHTAAGSNPYVRVGSGWAKLLTDTASVTYAGNAMTSVGLATASANWTASVNGYAQIFEYINPTGGAQNAIVTFSAGGNFGACGTNSYAGVDQVTASSGVQTRSGAQSAATTDSLAVSSNTGDMVSDCISVDTGFSSLTAGDTQRWNGAGTGYGGASQDMPGAATANIDWSWTTASGFAHVAANIIAAAGGATRPVKMAGWWGGYAGQSGGFAA